MKNQQEEKEFKNLKLIYSDIESGMKSEHRVVLDDGLYVGILEKGKSVFVIKNKVDDDSKLIKMDPVPICFGWETGFNSPREMRVYVYVKNKFGYISVIKAMEIYDHLIKFYRSEKKEIKFISGKKYSGTCSGNLIDVIKDNDSKLVDSLEKNSKRVETSISNTKNKFEVIRLSLGSLIKKSSESIKKLEVKVNDEELKLRKLIKSYYKEKEKNISLKARCNEPIKITKRRDSFYFLKDSLQNSVDILHWRENIFRVLSKV